MSADDWGIVLVTAAAIGGTLFVLLYAVFATWYGTLYGWGLMLGEAAFAGLLDIALYAHWAHKVPATWLVLGIYGFIAAASWLRVSAVAYSQIVKRKRSDLA